MRLRFFTGFTLLLISALLSSAAPVGFEPMPPPADAAFSPWLCTAALAPPCENAALSSSFGYRLSPFDGTLQFHCGVDLAAKKGSDVYAVLG